MTIIVTTQKELDAAIESSAEGIVIDSPPTAWLELRGSPNVVTQGSSHVVARELSYAVALGSSHVVAREWSRVEAWGSSNVVAWDLSRVNAREWSAVRAWGYSHVNATPWVTVHRHSTKTTVTGGIIIDITSLDLSDPAVWTAHHGVAPQDGAATVYKAVSRGLVAGQGQIPTTYAIDSTVDATDWDPAPQDGHGLHFSPTPFHASLYYQGAGEPRFLACEVDVASLVPLGDKCKAPSCRVLREVDIHADPIDAADIQERGGGVMSAPIEWSRWARWDEGGRTSLPPDLTPSLMPVARLCCADHPHGLICTRLPGHTGRHAAGDGDFIVAVWGDPA